MPTRRSLNAIFCSLLACSAYEAAAQLPVRSASVPRRIPIAELAANTPSTPPLRHLLRLPSCPDVAPMPFVSFTTTSPLSWPSLDGSIVRAVRFRELDLGPGLDDRLWGLQPDGGMVRWVGTVMEYEGPAWSTR